MSKALLDYVYNSLPQTYVRMDEPSTTLYRYLSAIIEGGYASVLQDSENLSNLLDPQKCPEEFLQFFYRSFGLTYFPDIAPIYHRRILENLGGIIQRRGTYSCISFLARAVTGTTVGLEYYRDPVDNHRVLRVIVICDSLDQLERLDTEIEVLSRFLRDYVPFYITEILVEGVVNVATVQDTRNDIVVASASFDYKVQHKPV